MANRDTVLGMTNAVNIWRDESEYSEVYLLISKQVHLTCGLYEDYLFLTVF